MPRRMFVLLKFALLTNGTLFPFPRSLRVLDSYSGFKKSLLQKFLVTQKKDLSF